MVRKPEAILIDTPDFLAAVAILSKAQAVEVVIVLSDDVGESEYEPGLARCACLILTTE
jgi:ABC-type sugar transport system substrate-binding protein